jgi:hypothetical protein
MQDLLLRVACLSRTLKGKNHQFPILVRSTAAASFEKVSDGMKT